MFVVTVTEIKTVEEKTKEYQKLTDAPKPNQQQYGYVEAVLPRKKENVVYRQEFDKINLPTLVNTLNS